MCHSVLVVLERLRCPKKAVLVEGLQSLAYLWDVRCAEYKNCNKKGNAFHLIAKKKNYEVSIAEVENKSPPSMVSFGDSTKILCEAWIFTEETNLVWLRSRIVFIATQTSQEEVAVSQ